jgi:hypothetical protein
MVQLAKWAEVIHFQKCFPYASIPCIIAGYLTGKPIHYNWDDWEYQIYQFCAPSRVMGWYLNTLEKTLPSLVDTIFSSE